MAKISPTMSSGISIPVEDLPPKAKAIRVTINTAIPLIPALDIPKIKAAKKAKTNDSSESNPFKYASIKRRYNLFLSRLRLKMCAV